MLFGGHFYYRRLADEQGGLKEWDRNQIKMQEGGSSVIRNIASDDPQTTAKDFFDRLTYGGIEKTLYYKDGTEKGKRVTMADGLTMNWSRNKALIRNQLVFLFFKNVFFV